MTEGERGILLKCWAGCELTRITEALGLRLADLFFDQGANPKQSRIQQQRRAQQRAESAHRTAETKTFLGKSIDLAREAEYFLVLASESNRSATSDQERDRLMNVIADAHTVLRSEKGEVAYVEFTCTLGRR